MKKTRPIAIQNGASGRMRRASSLEQFGKIINIGGTSAETEIFEEKNKNTNKSLSESQGYTSESKTSNTNSFSSTSYSWSWSRASVQNSPLANSLPAKLNNLALYSPKTSENKQNNTSTNEKEKQNRTKSNTQNTATAIINSSNEIISQWQQEQDKKHALSEMKTSPVVLPAKPLRRINSTPAVQMQLSGSLGKRIGSSTDLTEDQPAKIAKRLARKAEAARISRQRKKDYLQSLEERVNELMKRLERLESDSLELSDNFELAHREAQENNMFRLRQIISELDERSEEHEQNANTNAQLLDSIHTIIDASQYRQNAAVSLIASIEPHLLPNIVSKFLLWVLSQNDEFYGSNDQSLWKRVMAHDIGLTSQQMEQLIALRPLVQKLLHSVQLSRDHLSKLFNQSTELVHHRQETLSHLLASLRPLQQAECLLFVPSQ